METPDSKKLGKALKAIRLDMKLTQTDFGSLIEFTQKMVSAWEVDRVPINIRSARQICAKLNIPFSQFWGGQADIKPSKFQLPPDDVEALAPMIKILVKHRNQWGKYGQERKEEILEAIKTICDGDEAFENTRGWIEHKKKDPQESRTSNLDRIPHPPLPIRKKHHQPELDPSHTPTRGSHEHQPRRNL